jgi:hypothetical protein
MVGDLDVLYYGAAGNGLYIGTAIENTPYHARIKAAKAAGDPGPDTPAVDPDQLAELLWTMHRTRDKAEATYPEERPS